MRPTFAVGVLLLSAGCLGGSDEPATTDANDIADVGGDDPAPPTSADDALPPEPPAPTVVPVSWDGNLGTALWVCEFQVVQDSVNQVVAEYHDELYVEGLAGTVDAVSATLEWVATTPVNAELGFGVMVMAQDCDACNDTSIAAVTGESPLTIDASALGIPLDVPGTVVHFYVWNPKLYHFNDNVGVFGSVDDAFTVRGNVTIVGEG